MGHKFDARLPSMTDRELAEVDERTLNANSRRNLQLERQKRADLATSRQQQEARLQASRQQEVERSRDWKVWGIRTLVVTLIGIVVAWIKKG